VLRRWRNLPLTMTFARHQDLKTAADKFQRPDSSD
jgi:hypothetical protein